MKLIKKLFIVAFVACVVVLGLSALGAEYERECFEANISPLVYYGLLNVSNETFDAVLNTVLKDFPLRSIDNVVDIHDMTVKEVIDDMYYDVYCVYVKNNECVIVLSDKSPLLYKIEYLPLDKSIQYKYHLYNMRELGNRLAELSGFGKGYFDKMPFVYLKKPTCVGNYDSKYIFNNLEKVYLPTDTRGTACLSGCSF